MALAETNTEEISIIPLAVEMAAYDSANATMPNPMTQILDCFTFPARAESLAAKAIQCAVSSFLFDVGAVMAYSGEKFSLALFKQALRKVGTKLLGPVGTLLMMVEFGYCMKYS